MVVWSFMPRSARLDGPGVVHHVIIRGIERRKIFRDNKDRNDMMDRLADLLPATNTSCYAWAFLSNHAHFLARSGEKGLSTLMRRLLTGYAIGLNRRYRRHGHLFQNRYKSIICQEDIYLKELVRYIHLNPLRAKVVPDMRGLNRYKYCGHTIDKLEQRVLEMYPIEREELYSKIRQKVRAEARSVFCYWAVRELGVEGTQMAKRLNMSQPGISYAVSKGERIVKDNKFKMIE